jgi:hypothetical protein
VQDPRYSLLVSLDGVDADTVRFCDEWEVPLLYSEEQEGVGISKNRVLERFPEFDYYFFIEDDAELLDASVFHAHVAMSQQGDIHHFSLFERGGLRRPTGESMVAGKRVTHGLFGGADLNFFTGEGLRQVGGWHPDFAEYRCGGHTEHSYRFFRAGLAPAPFNFAVDLSDAFIWHAPPSVTRHNIAPVDDDQILVAERQLIDRELRRVPVQTLSPYHISTTQFAPPVRLAATTDGAERYPLIANGERREARSGYQLERFRRAPTLRERLLSGVAATWNWPSNPELRHAIKNAVRR